MQYHFQLRIFYFDTYKLRAANHRLVETSPPAPQAPLLKGEALAKALRTTKKEAAAGRL